MRFGTALLITVFATSTALITTALRWSNADTRAELASQAARARAAETATMAAMLASRPDRALSELVIHAVAPTTALRSFRLVEGRAQVTATFEVRGERQPHPPADALVRASARCLDAGTPDAVTTADGGVHTLAPVRDRDGHVDAVLAVSWSASHAARANSLVADLLLAALLAAAAALTAFVTIVRPLRAAVAALSPDGLPAPAITNLAGLVAAVRNGRREREAIQRTLEDRVRARTIELEEHAKQKDEILSNTVHELRTPLTTIIASVDMLRDGYATTADETRNFLSQASAACQHLMFLINDLLDTAAHEAGKLNLHMQVCYARDLLDDAKRIMTPVSMLRNVSFEVDELSSDLPLWADPSRTLQVIFNLVGNGLKYSPEETSVRLRSTTCEGGVIFEVIDEGRGVPVASREHLFDKFERVNSPESSAQRGSGIGLYMSRVLVEQMGGEIGYRERTEGPGSVFWFRLPDESRASRGGAATSAPPPAAEPAAPRAGAPTAGR